MTGRATHPRSGSVAFVLGTQWREHAALGIDLGDLVDHIDLVVGERSLTRSIGPTPLLTTLSVWVGAIHALARGTDKVIFSVPDEPWEIALRRVDLRSAAVSIYEVGGGIGFSALDTSLDLDGLARASAAAINELRGVFRGHALVAAIALEAAGLERALASISPPLTRPRWERREPLVARGAVGGATIELDVEATNALLHYDGALPLDEHALLARGRIRLFDRDREPLVLHDGPRLLAVLERFLRARGLPDGQVMPSRVERALHFAALRLVAALCERNPNLLVNARLAPLRRFLELEPAPLAEEVCTAPVAPLTTRKDPPEPMASAHPGVTLAGVRMARVERRWTQPCRAHLTGDVLRAGEFVVVGTAREILCVSLDTGELVWTLAVEDVPWIHFTDDGLIVASGPRVTCLDVASGGVRWGHEFGLTLDPWCEPPLVVWYDGASDPRRIALVSDDHRLVIRDGVGDTIFSGPVKDWSYAVPDESAVMLCAESGEIERLDVTTGATLWSLRTGHSARYAGLVGDAIVTAEQDDALDRVSLVARDPVSADVRWTYRSEGDFVRLDDFGDAVLLCIEQVAGVAWTALDARGEVIWQRSPDSIWTAPIAALADREAFFVLEDDGTVFAWSRNTGEELWRQHVRPLSEHAAVPSIYLLDSTILVAHDAVLLLLDPQTGRRLCEVDGLPGDAEFLLPLSATRFLVASGDGPRAVELFEVRHFLGLVR